MPIVTTSRPLPASASSTWNFKYRGNPYASGYWSGLVTNQTTTSYRSGRAWDPLQDEEALVNNSRNQFDFVRGLQKDLKDNNNLDLDYGHEFHTAKTKVTYPESSIRCYRKAAGTGYTYDYSGFMYPTDNVYPLYPGDQSPSPSQIIEDGTRAIAATIPTKAEANLAVFLGELREQLPQLVGHQLLKKGLSTNSLAEEHLNWQFGILPTASDLRKLAQGVLHANKLAKQLVRDSEKTIRRGLSLGTTRSVVDVGVINTSLAMGPVDGSSANTVNFFYSSTGSTRVYDVFENSSWFKGAYTYYLDKSHNFLASLETYGQKADRFLGLKLTPEVIYELTPWSWLLGWVSDSNAFMRNVSYLQDNNLVLRYGYVMHETHATRFRDATGLVPLADTATAPRASHVYYEQVIKQRTRATPYGFGLDTGAFSPQRWAILGALGITKSPGNLRLIT